MRIRENVQQTSFWAFAFVSSFCEPKVRASMIAGTSLFLCGFLLRALAQSQVSLKKADGMRTSPRGTGFPAGIYRSITHPDFLGWALILSGTAIATEQILVAEAVALCISLSLLLLGLKQYRQLDKARVYVWDQANDDVGDSSWLPRLFPLPATNDTAVIRHSFSRGLWKGKSGELRRALPIIVAFATLWIYLWTPGVSWVRLTGMFTNFSVGLILFFDLLRGSKRSALE